MVPIHISDASNLLPSCNKSLKKKSLLEDFRANILEEIKMAGDAPGGVVSVDKKPSFTLSLI